MIFEWRTGMPYMACRNHDACSSMQLGYTERHRRRNRRLGVEPDRDPLCDESVCGQSGELGGIVASIMANNDAIGGNITKVLLQVHRQTLRCLNDSQTIHAREARCHATPETSGAKLDSCSFCGLDMTGRGA